MVAARNRGRYGPWDATMILLANAMATPEGGAHLIQRFLAGLI